MLIAVMEELVLVFTHGEHTCMLFFFQKNKKIKTKMKKR